MPPGGEPGEILIKAEFHTLVWSESLPDGGRAIMKMYRRRPFYDPLRRWFIPYRAEREFRVLSHLVRHGIPCSEPLSWSHGRQDPHGRHELLATREVEGATALDKLLQSPGAVTDLTQLLRLVRRMHDCGVSHGGLAPRNILVTLSQGIPAFHIIDMSYSCIFPQGIAGTRMATFDLLDLAYRLRRHFPPERCDAWLAAGYGLDESAVRRLDSALGHYHPKRPWSHLRRGETDLRAAIARLRAPRSRPVGGNRPGGPPAASGT